MTTDESVDLEQRDADGPTSAKILVVIEDDPDVQFLIEAIIVLDHGLAGSLPGLAAAPLLKERAPQAKIIMFTAHAALQARADIEPTIDAFLLKTESEKLLPLAQQLIGLGPAAA